MTAANEPATTGFILGDQLLDYWIGLSRATKFAIPAKSHLNPMHIPDILPQFFMIERHSRDHYCVRLQGTVLDTFTGSLNQGQNILSFHQESCRDTFQSLLTKIACEAKIANMVREVRLDDGRLLDIKSVVLPLFDDNGKPRFIIGCSIVIKVKEARQNNGKGCLVRETLKSYDFIHLFPDLMADKKYAIA